MRIGLEIARPGAAGVCDPSPAAGSTRPIEVPGVSADRIELARDLGVCTTLSSLVRGNHEMLEFNAYRFINARGLIRPYPTIPNEQRRIRGSASPSLRRA